LSVVITKREMYKAALVFVVVGNAATAIPSSGPLPKGPELEHFLRTASIESMTPIGVGITKPMKVRLTDGERSLHAVWKSVDEHRHGVHRGRGGGYQNSFKDSYKYEVAAYELDKLLDLGLVPPTVERKIEGRKGSLQLWIEDGFTELDRREKGLEPSDAVAWSNEIYKWRLLQQLTYNDDAHNLRNVLYDRGFRVYAIDNSRSFRRFHALVNASELRRFSRSVLERLAMLTRSELERNLSPWLQGVEIDALLARRDLILDRADTLAADVGTDKIFYP